MHTIGLFQTSTSELCRRRTCPFASFGSIYPIMDSLAIMIFDIEMIQAPRNSLYDEGNRISMDFLGRNCVWYTLLERE